MGVVVRRYIDFLILLPTPLVVSGFFCSSIPTFVHLKNVFSFLFQNFFVMKFYVLKLKKFKQYIAATRKFCRSRVRGSAL